MNDPLLVVGARVAMWLHYTGPYTMVTLICRAPSGNARAHPSVLPRWLIEFPDRTRRWEYEHDLAGHVATTIEELKTRRDAERAAQQATISPYQQ